jgi:hypothetical protein
VNIEHSVGARVPLLTVIVPVYNEAPTIGRILARVLSAPYAKQVIVVDDGSTDATPDILRILAERPEVTVLTHDRNRGKGRAIRTALVHAQGTYILIQDADLEYWPEDYPLLIEPLLAREADVVYGSRYLNPSQRHGHGLFRYGVSFLNLCVRWLYGVRLTDEATCYKVFPTSTLQAMNLQCERFEFCPEVTAKACRMGLRIREVPIRYDARGSAEGKKIRWTDGMAAFRTLWTFRVSSPVVLSVEFIKPEVDQFGGSAN